MSAKGNCYENTWAENFFDSVKVEGSDDQGFETHGAMRKRVFEYIEAFHNREPLHFANDYLSQVKEELQHQAA